MRRRFTRAAPLAGILLAVLAGCAEPEIDVQIPDRAGHVADLAGILDAERLDEQLGQIAADGLDVVALTYTTSQANCGEAFRAGLEMATRWQADIALVAVARPGDFTSTEDDRERCVGLRPVDDFAVGRGLREEIAEVLVPPLAADNQWDQVFEAAAQRLARSLTEGADTQ